MNEWLTLPNRLAIVAILGGCLWLVLSRTSNQLTSQLNSTGSQAAQVESDSADPVAPTPVASNRVSWLDKVARVLPTAIVFVISFFIFYEWICYRLFVRARRQVADCGGESRSNLKLDWLWLQYLYCTTDVEICHSEIKAGKFPLLSHIPRLRQVRLWHVKLPESEVANVANELSRCRDLERLEIGGTNVTAIDLGHTGLLEAVPQVILD